MKIEITKEKMNQIGRDAEHVLEAIFPVCGIVLVLFGTILVSSFMLWFIAEAIRAVFGIDCPVCP